MATNAAGKPSRSRLLVKFGMLLLVAALAHQAYSFKPLASRNAGGSTKVVAAALGRQAIHLMHQVNDMGYCPVKPLPSAESSSTNVQIHGGSASPASSSLRLASSEAQSFATTSAIESSSSGRRLQKPASSSRKADAEELRSPLCRELKARVAAGDKHWSAKTCRFFARNIERRGGFVDICTGVYDHADLHNHCGTMLAVADAQAERKVHPYTRQAPTTFFYWNKALAAKCDVSPTKMVDDSWDLPHADYQPHVGDVASKTYYVVTTQCGKWIQHVMPSINHPFVLVTGSADYSAPLLSGSEGALNHARQALNNPNLIAWFAQNPDMVHPKLIPVPIGIDYHTLAIPDMKEHAWGTPTSAEAQDALLQELRCTLPPFHSRPPHAVMNFKAAGRDVRSYVHNLLNGREGVTYIGGVQRSELWRMYGDFAFVISPRGYGKDCHRTWEALTLGCAVIVSKDHHLRPLYDDLPVIQLEEWEQVTAENLVRWQGELSSKWHTFRWEKLRGQFWLDAVNRAAKTGKVEDFWKTTRFKNNAAEGFDETDSAFGEFVYPG